MKINYVSSIIYNYFKCSINSSLFLQDRFWRKTRSPTSIPQCPGVDANRNFDIHWNGKPDIRKCIFHCYYDIIN